MDSASSSSSSTVDPLVDGVIKGFVCLAGCEDQLTAFGAACFPKSDDDRAATPTPDAQACTKATAALRSCMQATAGLYESYMRSLHN
jgi:hypothetical protein